MSIAVAPRRLKRKFTDFVRPPHAWQRLDRNMPEVNRAFTKVRNELCHVGLLDVGIYLDDVNLYVARFRSAGESGYVWENLHVEQLLAGQKRGMIYLPCNLPRRAYVPGGTLTDTIRHEFAHAWHYLDPSFFEDAWFYDAFGGSYCDDTAFAPLHDWLSAKVSEDGSTAGNDLRRMKRKPTAAEKRLLKNDFVSEYAYTDRKEDFAETFMLFLRYRKSLARFLHRPGVYRKVTAIRQAVSRKKKMLGL